MEFITGLPWAELALWAGALLLIAAGFAGMVLPALPGPPLLLGGLFLAAWAEDFTPVGTGTLVVLSLLCVLALVLDFVAGALGAKRYGASGAAVTGALVGAVVGIFLGPLGLLIGPFAGAMLGELATGRPWQQAGRAGVGATLGMLLGIVAKVVIGIVMLGTYVLVRVFG